MDSLSKHEGLNSQAIEVNLSGQDDEAYIQAS